MRYNEAGTYTLEYKAVDECGNETIAERTVVVSVPVTKHTVLYEDGFFIINELSTARASNLTKHGNVVYEYDPLDSQNDYVFSNANSQPWFNQKSQIQSVEFGSDVSPTSIAYWFSSCTNLERIDWVNFDGSRVTTARAFINGSSIIDIAFPPMPNLTSIQYICQGSLALSSADFSQVGATGITNTQDAFQGCYELTEVDFSGLAGTVNTADRTFANLSGGGNMALQTIYANSNLVFVAGTNMFRACVDLVGGNGTQFDANNVGYQYARIDTASTPGYFTAKE